MKIFKLPEWWPVLVIAAVVASPFAYIIYRAETAPPYTATTGVQIIREDRTQYEEGASAFRAGVSAEANPYRGSGGFLNVTAPAERWLRGWIDAKKQAENK